MRNTVIYYTLALVRETDITYTFLHTRAQWLLWQNSRVAHGTLSGHTSSYGEKMGHPIWSGRCCWGGDEGGRTWVNYQEKQKRCSGPFSKVPGKQRQGASPGGQTGCLSARTCCMSELWSRGVLVGSGGSERKQRVDQELAEVAGGQSHFLWNGCLKFCKS